VPVEVVGLRVGAPLGAACQCYAVGDRSTLVLLDFGPGALERPWRHGLVAEAAAIVISHMHMDHMLDLLPLSGEMTRLAVSRRWPGRRAPTIYVPRGRGPTALSALAAAVGSSPVRFGEAFEVCEYDDGDRLDIGALRVSFARIAHPEPCYSARITDGASTIAHGADGADSDELVAHASGADLLLLEATYLDDGPRCAATGTSPASRPASSRSGRASGAWCSRTPARGPSTTPRTCAARANGSPATSSWPARAPSTPPRRTPTAGHLRSWRRSPRQHSPRRTTRYASAPWPTRRGGGPPPAGRQTARHGRSRRSSPAARA
jgi:Beta-lactamase superfamily domain